MKKLGVIGALLAMAALGALPAHGDQGAHRPRAMVRRGMDMAFPFFLRGVELNDTQKSQVKEIMTAYRAAVRDLLTQLQAVQDEIENKLLSTESLEEADLKPQIAELSELRNRLSEENLKISLEIRKLLTPEQLAQAAAHREQMRARWTEMKERFRQKRSLDESR
ncbi:MAG TPA: Spy/CpxP family protein refolding chaperone [Candidatus Acidoferrales bacterium]|nr:Spy/CpxP family protein refolding chaperone [Candidatus Acidoferrales bacterium]